MGKLELEKVKILELCLKFNFNIAPDALEYLIELSPPEKHFVNFLENITKDIPVITLHQIQNNFDVDTTKKDVSISNREDLKQEITPMKISKIEISIDKEIPFKLSQEPNIKAFRKMFIQRYHHLSQMIIKSLSPERVILNRNLQKNEIPPNRTGILIGMVQDTGVLHTNRFVINLEDPLTGKTTKCVMVQEPPSFPEYRNILRDTVIGIIGVLPKNFIEGELTALWGRDIVRPSFKNHLFETKNRHSRVLCISDIHFGSKKFVNNLFSRLIAFLNDEVQIDDKFLSSEKIDTLVIAGDLVDGIKLSRNDVQNDKKNSLENLYQNLSELLRKIPSSINIIVLPGEKDASQMVVPQPPIDKKVGESLYSLPNVQNHGNPLRMTINGMKFLIFHGQGYEQIFQDRLKLEVNEMIDGMTVLLEYRHLFPEYGPFIPIAPYSNDFLVIDAIPDIIITGHLHKSNYRMYKGIRIVNCGTFLRDEEDKEDLSSLGVFPIIETGTGEIKMLDLKKLKYK